jgi:glucose/arabinose dehydrogenase
MNRHFIASISLVFLTVFFVSKALANPTILGDWRSRYTESTSDDAANCQLCHQNNGGGDGWNGYGWAVRGIYLSNGNNASAAFASVEGENSDNDPTLSTNVAEIIANTQPGWTSGAVNTIYFKDDSILSNQSPPDVGVLDPVVATPPDISGTPGFLDFGVVVIGAQDTQNISIQNIGGSDLVISSIDLCTGTTGEFAPIPLSNLTIVPGDIENLSIIYTPVDEGVDTDCIDVSSNDPDQSIVTFNLAGEGLLPGAELDIDIDTFNVTADTQIGGSPVAISLDVRHNSTSIESSTATVEGIQNSASVYSESVIFFTDPSNVTQSIPFPDFTPVETGTINWTANVVDVNPDDDNFTAATNVSSLAISDPIPGGIRSGSIQITLEPVATGLLAPNYGISAPGLPDHLFVVDQPGQVWKINLTDGNKGVFLDVSLDLVSLGVVGPGSFDERGLLGIAFHPDYAMNGLVYTFTSEPVTGGVADYSTLPPGEADHHSVISEWQVSNPGDTSSLVDPASKRVLLRVGEPQFNHDGGTVAFGPDGMLYIALGDGGGADDHDGQPFFGSGLVGHGATGNGRDATNPLGAILRIDPTGNDSTNGQYGIPTDNPFSDPADPRLAEIYAYGFRNPFRFSFDTRTGDLYAADVGQNDIEEVDLVVNGGNYGWNYKEGSFFFDPNGTGNGFVTNEIPDGLPSDLIDPILEYDHDEGISITGGFVYRGTSIRPLGGRYVFGDWSGDFSIPSGRLFYRLGRNGIREFTYADRDSLGLFLHGFGQDAAGEMYIMANETGNPFPKDGVNTGVVLRITPAPKGGKP